MGLTPSHYESTIGEDLSLKEIAKDHWVAADPCCVSTEDWKKLRPKTVSLK